MDKSHKPSWGLFRPFIIIIGVYLIYLIGESIIFFIGALIQRFAVPNNSIESVFSITDFILRILLILTFIAAVFIGEKFIFKEILLPTPYHPRASTERDILIGLMVGGLLFTLLFLVFWALEWLIIVGSFIQGAPKEFIRIIWSLPVFLMVAVFEELFARGFLLSTLKKYYGMPAGITFSSFFFSLMHLNNPNINLWGLFGILGAGVWLGLSYELTGSLYFPTALHFSWNLFQSLLGFPVSGLNTPTLVSTRITGPALWTGGEFGPEAGIAGYCLIALGIIITIWYGKKEKAP